MEEASSIGKAIEEAWKLAEAGSVLEIVQLIKREEKYYEI